MNKDKDVPFTKDQMANIVDKVPTPFHIIEELLVRDNARELNRAFSWVPGFKNYFAVKSCPNPVVVDILRQEGNGADCSSLPELLLSERVGIKGQNIMFTSNNTPAIEFQLARELGAIINLDDITHIPFLERHAGIPDTICFRYNPGPLRKTAEGNVIGNPQDAKYGLTKDQLFMAYGIMKKKGVKHFGLHTMIASNELNFTAFVETFKMLALLGIELKKELGIRLEFINIGGGIGVAYRPSQNPVNYHQLSDGIKDVYDKLVVRAGLAPLKIFMENGRLTSSHD